MARAPELPKSFRHRRRISLDERISRESKDTLHEYIADPEPQISPILKIYETAIALINSGLSFSLTVEEERVLRKLATRSESQVEMAKWLYLTPRRVKSIVNSIGKKLITCFPGDRLSKKLRLFREIPGTDGVEELVSKRKERALYRIGRLRNYAPSLKFHKRTRKGELLDKAAEEMLREIGEEAPDRLPKGAPKTYEDALIALTRSKLRCQNLQCRQPIPYLRKKDPLRKYLPQKFIRKRKVCSPSCRVQKSRKK